MVCSAGGTLERHVAAAARNVAFRDQLSMSHHMLAPFLIIIIIDVLIYIIVDILKQNHKQTEKSLSKWDT